MSVKLENELKKNPNIKNEKNSQLILQYHKFSKVRNTSDIHRKNNLKITIKFAEYLAKQNFNDVKDRQVILEFLDRTRKNKEEDPEQRWITTWNDYLVRIKYFFRWLYNFNEDLENL